MKPKIHIGWLVFFGLLLIALGYHIHDWFYVPFKTITVKEKKNFDIITFKLPNSHDPDIFGAPYWKARHFLSEMTPCPSCRKEAVSHEIFFHDFINKKLKKNLYNPENFDKWVEKICNPKTEKA